jgi:transposase-like protein
VSNGWTVLRTLLTFLEAPKEIKEIVITAKAMKKLRKF